MAQDHKENSGRDNLAYFPALTMTVPAIAYFMQAIFCLCVRFKTC